MHVLFCILIKFQWVWFLRIELITIIGSGKFWHQTSNKSLPKQDLWQPLLSISHIGLIRNVCIEFIFIKILSKLAQMTLSQPNVSWADIRAWLLKTMTLISNKNIYICIFALYNEMNPIDIAIAHIMYVLLIMLMQARIADINDCQVSKCLIKNICICDLFKPQKL